MTALASALLRAWTAKTWPPRLTGRGVPVELSFSRKFGSMLAEAGSAVSELLALAQRTAPTVVIIALRIFR